MGKRRRKADVSDRKKPVLDFQRFVWGRLPMRKYLCGHNRVFDVVAVLIQEWPVDAIDHASSGDTPEVHALEELVASCKRHLALAYGEPEWDAWAGVLRYIIWQSVWIILHWYRHDPLNRSALIRMRSQWRWKRS